MSNLDWDSKQFLAFLLIYASHADIEFSIEEKSQIKERVSSEVFEEMYAIFNTYTDYQALEEILSYKDVYFSTPSEKEALFTEMKNLFQADGDFSILEKELLVFLDKLM